MNVLGIETSCDETAAAIVSGSAAGPSLRASIVASQVAMHRPFGGVVPEVASRGHIRFINGVIERALARARIRPENLDAIAATAGPGLPGALLVGLTAGKAMAYLFRLPYLAINHIEAHIYGAFLREPGLKPPLLALVVSGGHTDLIEMPRHGEFRILGRTRDDAAGEAFDKVAKLMSLGYPGGPGVERVARRARRAYALPVARMKDGSMDFSFSGLKTAVLLALPRVRSRGELALGFQRAVIEALAGRASSLLAGGRFRTLVLAGGVAANSALRERFSSLARKAGVKLVVPSMDLCTDNAAMVACAGWFGLKRGERSGLEIPASPGWKAGDRPAPGSRRERRS